MATDSTMTGLPSREVRTGERAGRPTRSTILRRTYATDRDDLWHAITDPDRLPRWFLPVSGDLELGGRYQFEGNAGGTVETCDPPTSLSVTWEMGDQISWVHITLAPSTDGTTTLELAHEAPVDDPTSWEQFGPGAAGVGWDLGLLGLGLHLESGAAVDPQEAMAYSTSEEGIAFMRESATGWAEAAIADGDDPDAAHAAAERTIAFYTGADQQ